jgi:DNA invertase Pin-like site-specific DNA recombinase
VTGDIDGNGDEQVMIRQIISVIAEYERKITSTRTSFAMKQHQRNGRRMGRFAPYGWKIDEEDGSRIVKDLDEQKALELVAQLHKLELTPAEITKRLNEVYPECSRAKKWNRKSVGKIIERMDKI